MEILDRTNYAKRPHLCRNPECKKPLPAESIKRRRRYCDKQCNNRANYLKRLKEV